MMKKIVAIILAVLMLSSVPVMAENSGGKTTLMFDGLERELVAYKINDNNYFKLRDIANLLKGTEAQFDVAWNESVEAVEITTGAPYSTEEEITEELLDNPTAKPSYSPIYKDGGRILLKAYEIGGNNFFKLRDLAAALDFGVDWTEETGIMVDSSASYKYPVVSDFAVNLETMSLIGKTKAEIDAKYGQGDYSTEFGLVDYNNGIMMGFNSLGDFPKEDYPAETMYVSMEKLFYNCPDTLSQELITSAFDHSCTSYDEMDEENILCVNYCGITICFPMDRPIDKSEYVLVNIFNPYYGEVPGIPLATQEQGGGREFVGYYTDDETQSYFTLTLRTEGWTVDMYLVRNFSGVSVAQVLDDYTMRFTSPLAKPFAGEFELKWSEDYQEVVLTDMEYGTEWNFKAQ